MLHRNLIFLNSKYFSFEVADRGSETQHREGKKWILYVRTLGLAMCITYSVKLNDLDHLCFQRAV